ncbi:hypothetical protein HA071_26575, partial [Escherichia coli]|nr:hypothetical protein [Escherichia coli]
NFDTAKSVKTLFGSVVEAFEPANDLGGTILIDITNSLTPDYTALTIGHTTARETSQGSGEVTLLPYGPQ